MFVEFFQVTFERKSRKKQWLDQEKKMDLFRMPFESAPSPLKLSFWRLWNVTFFMCWFSLLNSEIGLWGNHKMSFFFFRYLKILVERKMCSKCVFDHTYLVESQDSTQCVACSKCSLDICGMNEGLTGARTFSS